MPNIIQKWIYNLSAAAPLCLVFAVTWFLQKHTERGAWIIPAICVAISIGLIVLFKVSFDYCRRNLPPIEIRINEFAPHDAWIIAYIISYVLPFASIVFNDFSPILSGAIAIVIILVAPFVNSATPNPLLFLWGYHFYLVKAEHGASDFVLIRKRVLRNKKEVKYVYRIFEFLLLDGGDN